MKKGFTLIETMMVLALTATLAAGIIAMTAAPIARQRYNNSVAKFEDDLASVFSSVLSVQNFNDGRSDSLIYGKLLSFGEETSPYDGYNTNFYTYDIVGDVYDPAEGLRGTTLDLLRAENISISFKDETNPGEFDFFLRSSFLFPGRIEAPRLGSNFAGLILIVRSPITGSISVYSHTTSGSDISNTEFWDSIRTSVCGPSTSVSDCMKNPNFLTKLINDGKIVSDSSMRAIDFCLYTDDVYYAGNTRRAVRINKNATNSSSVVLVPTDISEDNPEYSKCSKK